MSQESELSAAKAESELERLRNPETMTEAELKAYERAYIAKRADRHQKEWAAKQRQQEVQREHYRQEYIKRNAKRLEVGQEVYEKIVMDLFSGDLGWMSNEDYPWMN